MEILVDKFKHLLLIAIDIGTQSLVAVRAQTLDDTIYHGRAEYIVLLEDGTLLF